MEKSKKLRLAIRSSFTKLCTKITDALKQDDIDLNMIKANYTILQQRNEDLNKMNAAILDKMAEDDAIPEKELSIEIETSDSYSAKVYEIGSMIQALEESAESVAGSVQGSASSMRSSLNGRGVGVRIPNIELPKFNGDPLNWLPFWAQFEKVHEDCSIIDEDKFALLIQSTVPGSRAREVVESFPPTKKNYEKAIEALKTRFAKKNLLVDVYVRQLLDLVLKQVNDDVVRLYDRLETSIRSLESLGITSEECSALLYPLVESCLSEELCRIWQRTQNKNEEPKERLNSLLKFLEAEAEGEVRMKLSKSFQPKEKKKPNRVSMPESQKEVSIPTAAGLVNRTSQRKCIFCSDAQHDSADCNQEMSIEKRLKILKERNHCFKCLGFGHRASVCKRFIKCNICSRHHRDVLCPTKIKGTAVNSVVGEGIGEEVLLQTVVVKVNGVSGKSVTARALLDSGSQRSYIRSDLAGKLGLVSVGTEELRHSLFGGTVTKAQAHQRYSVRISSLRGEYSCVISVLNHPYICSSLPKVPEKLAEQLSRRGIQIADSSGEIDLLIGADGIGKLFTGEKLEISSDLIAIGTHLGWTVVGRPSSGGVGVVTATSLVKNNLPDLWALESLGINDPVVEKSRSDILVETDEHFKSTVSRDSEGRYIVCMPWLSDHLPLPTNFSVALRRLDRTLAVLKQKNMRDQYDDVLKTWLREGIICVDEDPDHAVGHYLPHRPVVKENSSTKIRPVFDASACVKPHPSLNDCVSKGVNLIETINQILLRFRWKRVGVSGDIRKAFLQIGLHPSDQNYLKFLWKDLKGNLRVFKHCRVVFGVSCSPYLLGAVLRHHLSCDTNFDKEFLELLRSSFYVDNCLVSLDDEGQINKFIKDSTRVLSEACFELRDWESTFEPYNNSDKKETSVLGMIWDRSDDTLRINPENFKIKEGKVTKRTILSVAHKVFDIVGFSSPVMLVPKILLQDLWESKIGWDVEVPDPFKRKFLSWARELDCLLKIRIPRWINGPGLGVQGNISLHMFCDASQAAVSAALFTRTEYSENIIVQLVAAKSRVLPRKKVTIPRGELIAATISVRLRRSFDKDLVRIPCTYWSDSTTALTWILQEEKWSVFVANRVSEIRKNMLDGDEWRHVPGNKNPADLPSRGCNGDKLVASRWWEGPDWLRGPVSSWPSRDFDQDYDEVRKEKSPRVVSCGLTVPAPKWYFNYFSRFSKIVRMVAWIRRFISNCRKTKTNRITRSLTQDEISNAEGLIFRWIQNECFNGSLSNIPQHLSPFKDESGLIRLRTKIANRDDSPDFCYPIVLPQHHTVIERLIREKHEQNAHVGLLGLTSILREEFWILGGRKYLRTVLNKCLRCKRFSGKAVETPSIPLPVNRVRDACVFEVVGVDLAGPLYLKGNQKVWVCLYTCAVYRAVHIELLSSLSTECFIQGFRRFVARRGRPRDIYCDNGTNFVGCANIFKAINWEDVASSNVSQKIRWSFNPPTASWWGGWWERLIRTLKDMLRKVLGRASLSYEEMVTVLCDCEAIMNARPLTYTYESSGEYKVLTPSTFLQDIREVGVPECDRADREYLSRRARFRQTLKEHLRRRFRSEYLGMLTYSKTGKNNFKGPCPQVGSIVLVGDDNSKRLDWPLGKVLELFPGKDGNARVAKVKTSAGELIRPVQRLYLLEVESNATTKNVAPLAEPEPPSEQDSVSEPISKPHVTSSGRKVNVPCRFRD